MRPRTYKQAAQEVANFISGRRASHVHENHGSWALGACGILGDWRDDCGKFATLCRQLGHCQGASGAQRHAFEQLSSRKPYAHFERCFCVVQGKAPEVGGEPKSNKAGKPRFRAQCNDVEIGSLLGGTVAGANFAWVLVSALSTH